MCILGKLNTYSSIAELLSGLVDVRSFRVNLVVLAAAVCAKLMFRGLQAGDERALNARGAGALWLETPY